MSFPFRPSAVILPDGAPEKLGGGDEAGSEEDLYEELRSSGHRFPHPGGAGEQLAINEVGDVSVTCSNITYYFKSASHTTLSLRHVFS